MVVLDTAYYLDTCSCQIDCRGHFGAQPLQLLFLDTIYLPRIHQLQQPIEAEAEKQCTCLLTCSMLMLTDSSARVAAMAALKTMQHFSRFEIADLTSPRSSLTARLQSCTQLKQRCSLSDFSVVEK